MQTVSHACASLLHFLAGRTSGQLICFLLSAAVWLIGANVLFAFHYRRTGRPWHAGFKPFAFPLRTFNVQEWLIFLGLAVVSLLFGIIATAR